MTYRLVISCMLLIFFWSEGAALGRGGDIVYTRPQAGLWEIWTIDSLGNSPQKLIGMDQDLREPAWSPDRSRVAYTNNSGGLFVVNVQTKAVKHLGDVNGKCDFPTWNPDGQSVTFVFFTFHQGEDSDIFQADVDANKMNAAHATITSEALESYPSWSPDGQQLAYTVFYRNTYHEVVEDLWIWDQATHKHYPLLQSGGQNFHPDWSPDGSSLIFGSNMSGDFEIWLLSYHPVQLMRLTSTPGYDGQPCWSPDGQHIAFVSSRSGQRQIWVMDKDGNNQRQLTVHPAGCDNPDW